MKTIFRDLLQADWGPTMRGIAWTLGHAVAIPAAVLIVMVQWLAFTWRRPLAGASISETELGSMSMRMDFGMATTTPPVAPLPPVLAPAPRRQRRRSNRPQSPA